MGGEGPEPGPTFGNISTKWMLSESFTPEVVAPVDLQKQRNSRDLATQTNSQGILKIYSSHVLCKKNTGVYSNARRSLISVASFANRIFKCKQNFLSGLLLAFATQNLEEDDVSKIRTQLQRAVSLELRPCHSDFIKKPNGQLGHPLIKKDQRTPSWLLCSIFHSLVIKIFPTLHLEYITDKWLCLTFHVHWIIPVCIYINRMMAHYHVVILRMTKALAFLKLRNALFP